MKRLIVVAAAAIMTAMGVQAQNSDVTPYFELNQLPKLIDIMPAPPHFRQPGVCQRRGTLWLGQATTGG